MDVAVGQQPDQVEARAPRDNVAHQALPHRTPEQGTGGDRVVHQLGALLEDPSGAHGVVTDLGVAHVRVARQADRGAVGRQPQKHRRGREQAVEVRGGGEIERVCGIPLRAASVEPNPVQDHQHERTVDARESRMSCQFEIGHVRLRRLTQQPARATVVSVVVIPPCRQRGSPCITFREAAWRAGGARRSLARPAPPVSSPRLPGA
jgi:hypothetical protein